MRSGGEFSPTGVSLHELLQRLGILGVVTPGSLAWDTFPSAADALALTSSASANTDGTWTDVTGTNGIAVPYWVTHVAWVQVTNSDDRRYRLGLREDAGSSARRRLAIMGNVHSDAGANWYRAAGVRCMLPMLMAPSTFLEAALANEAAAAEQVDIYTTVLKRKPVIMPANMRQFSTITPLGNKTPGNVSGLAVTADGAGWGTWGAYAELQAGFASPVLITAVAIDTAATGNMQAAFATGAGGSEIDWGVFGHPRLVGNAELRGWVYYDLMPYCLALPASTRVASRLRAASGLSAAVQFEYLPI